MLLMGVAGLRGPRLSSLMPCTHVRGVQRPGNLVPCFAAVFWDLNFREPEQTRSIYRLLKRKDIRPTLKDKEVLTAYLEGMRSCRGVGGLVARSVAC